jgi:hypothetical protein
MDIYNEKVNGFTVLELTCLTKKHYVFKTIVLGFTQFLQQESYITKKDFAEFFGYKESFLNLIDDYNNVKDINNLKLEEISAWNNMPSDLLKFNRIIFPILLKENSYAAICVDFDKNKIFLYDSYEDLSSAIDRSHILNAIDNIINTVLQFQKKDKFFFEHVVVECPTQTHENDNAVFVCLFMYNIINNFEKFLEINYFRNMMFFALLETCAKELQAYFL